MITLNSLIGLSSLKKRVRLQIKVCKMTGEIFSHSLLTGVGGTGKTAFARAIGSELGYHFIETHAAKFKKRDQLYDFLIRHFQAEKKQGCPLLFFLDEIHGLRAQLQEALYSVMKEWWIPDRNFFVDPFTLIGATTRFDMLDANSFVTRFPNVWEISRYPVEDIKEIIAYEFDKLRLRYNEEVVADIAQRCLGIPRIAVTLARKVRMTTIASEMKEVTLDHAEMTFSLEGIDELGLQPVHVKYLRILESSQVDGHLTPLGIGPIAGKMRRHEDMIKGSVEPILLEFDMVSPTSRGRILTATGMDYLKNKETVA